MYLKKIITYLVTFVLLFVSVFSLAACGNMDLLDTNFTIRYIVIKESNGSPIMHEVRSWSDSESDAAMVRTDCCNNYIWTSSNNATLYESMPNYLVEGIDYIQCNHMGV